MNDSSPAVVTIIEHVLPYLSQKDLAACRLVNRTWSVLATVQSARALESPLVRLPLRILHYRRKGLLSTIRSMDIDISYIDGFLSAPMYERRIRDAIEMAGTMLPMVKALKVRMQPTQSLRSQNETRLTRLAFNMLMSAFPQLTALELSECSVSVLDTEHASPFAKLKRLQTIKWFTLGRNDMSSAAALCDLANANRHTLQVFYGMADGTDRAMRVLCQAPRIKKVDISGSNVSDEALLGLVRARGHSLHELTLSDCARLTKHSIGNLTPTMLPSLVSLDLYNVMVTTETYQHLFNMRTYWPYLQDLKLKAAIPHTSPRQDSLVNDDILEAIGSRCPMLVSLRLFGCHGITDEGLSSVLGNLGYLRELVVMHSTTDPLVQNSDGTEESDSESDATFHSARSSRRSSTRLDFSAGEESDSEFADASDLSQAGPSTGGLLLSVPSINDIWANIPSLPTHGLQQAATNSLVRRVDSSPQSTAPNSPCVSRSRNQRVFTSQALRRGVRSRRFNLLNLDMEYDSVCAEHLSRLSHLHVLCGRVITRHAKALIETQFPRCKMLVWNID